MCGPERRRRGGIALWRQPAEVHRRPGVRARSGTGRGDAPDAGVDIGSTEFLHDRLLELRTEGKAVLLVSSKLDEVQGLSDRLAVIHEGEFTGVVDPATVTEEEIGLLMAGRDARRRLRRGAAVHNAGPDPVGNGGVETDTGTDDTLEKTDDDIENEEVDA